MKKPWAGRFTGKTSRSVENYTESISFDKRLWKYDIEGSIAHAKMLSKQDIIPKRSGKHCQGSEGNIQGNRGGQVQVQPGLEDIHMNIEAALIRKIEIRRYASYGPFAQ